MTRRGGEGETRSDSPRHRVPASPRRDWIALAVILIVAAYFRFQGLDWDKGYLFHPDERKILMVAAQLELPANPLQFFSPDSPLNPQFFAYGSLPIYLLRLLGAFAPAVNYAVPWADSALVSYALLGRALSALFDLATIALIFLLGRRLYDARVGLLAAAGIAVTVLHIQLAHFYAVDTLLTFFVVATIYFAARYAETARPRDQIAMSVAFGLAMATKISALPLVVPIAVAVIRVQSEWERGRQGEGETHALPLSHSPTPPIFARLKRWIDQVWRARAMFAKIGVIAFAVFVITQPYALLDPIRYFGQVGTEAFVARGWVDYPYTRQYVGTAPYAYPIAQSSVWGMGLPLGIVAWIGSAIFLWRWWRTRGLARSGVEGWRDGFILSWALVYFFIVGGQYAKHLRYFLPLIPFLYLMAASAITSHASRTPALAGGARVTHHVLRFTFYGSLFLALVYSFVFVGIYTRDHPWFTISRWIYANVPAGATIALEHWDDRLPVSLRAFDESFDPSRYRSKILPMYDADDDAKLATLADNLAASDYVILASPRLYGAIPRLPARYPMSSRYYQLLFNGELGFDLAAFARNDPQLLRVALADDVLRDVGLTTPPLLARYFAGAWGWGRADESFTVYDHPMPLVFKKARALTREELNGLLNLK